MEKLYDNIKKELKEIEETGISASNIETASKLVKMLKELDEIKEKEVKQMREYNDYGRGGYRDGDYMDRRYGDENYGRRGVPGSGRRYSGDNNRMREYINRIADGAEMYEYGRSRYQHGDSEERIYEGLEKLMYAICMCVESMIDFAETPQEKEIIRKHIQKMRSI